MINPVQWCVLQARRGDGPWVIRRVGTLGLCLDRFADLTGVAATPPVQEALTQDKWTDDASTEWRIRVRKMS